MILSAAMPTRRNGRSATTQHYLRRGRSFVPIVAVHDHFRRAQKLPALKKTSSAGVKGQLSLTALLQMYLLVELGRRSQCAVVTDRPLIALWGAARAVAPQRSNTIVRGVAFPCPKREYQCQVRFQ